MVLMVMMKEEEVVMGGMMGMMKGKGFGQEVGDKVVCGGGAFWWWPSSRWNAQPDRLAEQNRTSQSERTCARARFWRFSRGRESRRHIKKTRRGGGGV
jgi:hypothetical protein